MIKRKIASNIIRIASWIQAGSESLIRSMEIKLNGGDKKEDYNKAQNLNLNSKSTGPPAHWIELVQRHVPELLKPALVSVETVDIEKTFPDSVKQVDCNLSGKEKVGFQTEVKIKTKKYFEQHAVKKAGREKKILSIREGQPELWEDTYNKKHITPRNNYYNSKKGGQIKPANYFKQGELHKQSGINKENLIMEKDYEIAESTHWPILHDESSKQIDSIETEDKWPKLIEKDLEWEKRGLAFEKKLQEAKWLRRIIDEQRGNLWSE